MYNFAHVKFFRLKNKYSQRYVYCQIFEPAPCTQTADENSGTIFKVSVASTVTLKSQDSNGYWCYFSVLPKGGDGSYTCNTFYQSSLNRYYYVWDDSNKRISIGINSIDGYSYWLRGNKDYSQCTPQRLDWPKGGESWWLVPAPAPIAGIKTRYVVLQLNGTNYLNINQIEAYTEAGVNVAKGKRVTASSIYPNALNALTNVVDGTATKWFHTNLQNKAWVQVDLGQEYPITKIKIVNRKDCCQNRISDSTVYLRNGSTQNVWIKKIASTEYVYEWTIA